MSDKHDRCFIIEAYASLKDAGVNLEDIEDKITAAFLSTPAANRYRCSSEDEYISFMRSLRGERRNNNQN